LQTKVHLNIFAEANGDRCR